MDEQFFNSLINSFAHHLSIHIFFKRYQMSPEKSDCHNFQMRVIRRNLINKVQYFLFFHFKNFGKQQSKKFPIELSFYFSPYFFSTDDRSKRISEIFIIQGKNWKVFVGLLMNSLIISFLSFF